MSASWRSFASLVLALWLAGCATPQAPVEPAAGGAPGQSQQPLAEPAPAPTRAAEVQADFAAGLAFIEAQRWEAAERVFRRLTREAPEHLGPWVNLGVALARQGKDEQALAVLRQAVQRAPGNAVAQHETAILLRRAGRFQQARSAYESALRVRPEMALAHRNLGLLCDLYLHDLDCALRHYQTYQSLLTEADQEVELWLLDLRRRIGQD